MIPGSSFFGWQSGANRDAAEEAIRTGEPVKLGFLEKLYGGKTEDAQNIVNRQQQKALNNKYAVQFAQLGVVVQPRWLASPMEHEQCFGTPASSLQVHERTQIRSGCAKKKKQDKKKK